MTTAQHHEPQPQQRSFHAVVIDRLVCVERREQGIPFYPQAYDIGTRAVGTNLSAY